MIKNQIFRNIAQPGMNAVELLATDEANNTATILILRGMFCPNETITIALDDFHSRYEVR